jgi:hypothetical protein
VALNASKDHDFRMWDILLFETIVLNIEYNGGVVEVSAEISNGNLFALS